VARGLEATATGRLLLVEVATAPGGDFDVYDAVRDDAVALGLPLVRIEHRRHQLEDLFRDEGAA
jgi:hypothetical protein